MSSTAATRLRGAVLLLLLAAPVPVAGQQLYGTDLAGWREPDRVPGLRGDALLAGANALLGGLTGGIVSEVRGGSFRHGFVAGAAGGALSWAGRRITVLDFDGAGLLGRQVGAVGASVVRNAAADRPVLSRIALPIGPLRLYVHRGDSTGTRLRLKLHAMEAYWTAKHALDPSLDFRAAASLSAGAPVFQKTGARVEIGGTELNGYQIGGTIVLSGVAGAGQDWTFAHERVHVLQSDFIGQAWSEPVEAWLMRRSAPTRFVHRFLDLGVVDPLVRTGLARGLGVRSGNRAQEFEATMLETR